MTKKYIKSLLLLIAAFFLVNASLANLELYNDVPFFEGITIFFKSIGMTSNISFLHIALVLFYFSVKVGFSSKEDEKYKIKLAGLLIISTVLTIVGFLIGKDAAVGYILSALFVMFSIVFLMLVKMNIIKFEKFVSRPSEVEDNTENDKTESEDDDEDYDEIVDLKEPVKEDKKALAQKRRTIKGGESIIDLNIDSVPGDEARVVDVDKEKYENAKAQQIHPRIIRVKEEKEEEDLSHGVAHLKGQDKGSKVWKYSKPSVDLLVDHKSKYPPLSEEELNTMQDELINALKSFSIDAKADGYVQGPTVTLFKVALATGVQVKKVEGASKDIARFLGVSSSAVRVLPTIPGTHDIGIEVPNRSRQTISFKKLSYSLSATNMQLPFALGASVTGDTYCVDIAKTPHLLIAGATGSGKSVCMNTLIASLLYTKSPNDVRLIMVDPKVVELQIYNDIPHLLTPVITDPKKAIMALDFCVEEMERRYRMLEPMKVRNIVGYNARLVEKRMNREKMPYIVVIIDEFADLMMAVGKDLESRIARIAAKARAVGIHLVLATQRPSTDIITGTIKNNIPGRVGFRVPAFVDSRTILDAGGAERLLGNGDMLYKSSDSQDLVRIQGGFISDDEVDAVAEYARSQGEPMYIDDSFFEDEIEAGDDYEDDLSYESRIEEAKSRWSERDEALLNAAWEVSVQRGGVSTSYIQRALRIGFNAAARIVDEMTARGIAGPMNGSKPRELLKFRNDE